MSKKTISKEPIPPQSLLGLQSWMSQAVTTPPHHSSPALKKANTFITASKSLDANERLHIYISDYWPRCIESLAEDLPLMSAFLGQDTFESIIIDYLTHHPSNTNDLYHLGQHLDTYFEKNYNGPHPEFLKNLTHYEWTQAEIYFAEKKPHFIPELLTKKQIKTLSTLPLQLQPCVIPLKINANYTVWKPKKGILPKLKPLFVVIYQDETFKVKEEIIPSGLYSVLECFKSGYTIENTIEKIISQSSKTISEADIQNWLSLCIKKLWLCHPQKEKKNV